MKRSLVTSIVTVLTLATGIWLWHSMEAPQSLRASGQWVTTWSGVIQPLVDSGGYGGAMTPPEFQDAWMHGVLENQTIRVMVRSTISGSHIRIRLTNEYGKQPLTIGAARIEGFPSPFSSTLPIPPGLAGAMAGIRQGSGGGAGSNPGVRGGFSPIIPMPNQDRPTPGSDRPILFGGQRSVLIAPGASIVSDHVDFETGDRGFMAISLYLPNKTERATWIRNANGSIFLGDATSIPAGAKPARGPAPGSYWLSGVEVWASTGSQALLIIDDDREPRDGRFFMDVTWQDYFMDRVLSNGGNWRYGVFGSSVTNCSMNGSCYVGGPNAAPGVIRRIQDAATNQSGVKWVVVAAGLEDILHATVGSGPHVEAMSKSSTEQVIAAHKVVIDSAHAFGLRICGVTYPPFLWNYTERGEAIRVAVNDWVRQSGAHDAVADFDAVLRDPANPSRRRPEFAQANSYDTRGIEALANSIDLSIFGGSEGR